MLRALSNVIGSSCNTGTIGSGSGTLAGSGVGPGAGVPIGPGTGSGVVIGTAVTVGSGELVARGSTSTEERLVGVGVGSGEGELAGNGEGLGIGVAAATGSVSTTDGRVAGGVADNPGPEAPESEISMSRPGAATCDCPHPNNKAEARKAPAALASFGALTTAVEGPRWRRRLRVDGRSIRKSSHRRCGVLQARRQAARRDRRSAGDGLPSLPLCAGCRYLPR